MQRAMGLYRHPDRGKYCEGTLQGEDVLVYKHLQKKNIFNFSVKVRQFTVQLPNECLNYSPVLRKMANLK